MHNTFSWWFLAKANVLGRHFIGCLGKIKEGPSFQLFRLGSYCFFHNSLSWVFLNGSNFALLPWRLRFEYMKVVNIIHLNFQRFKCRNSLILLPDPTAGGPTRSTSSSLKVSPLPCRFAPLRQELEENRTTPQDTHRLADTLTCSEILPQDQNINFRWWKRPSFHLGTSGWAWGGHPEFKICQWVSLRKWGFLLP